MSGSIKNLTRRLIAMRTSIKFLKQRSSIKFICLLGSILSLQLHAQETKDGFKNSFDDRQQMTSMPDSLAHSLRFPVTTPLQLVHDSDIQCLDPREEKDLAVPQNLKYMGMLTAMKADTLDLEKWKSDVYAALKMGNLQVVEFLVLNNDPWLFKSFRLFREKLSFLSQFGVGVIVIVQELLFDPSTGHINDNYKSLWKKMRLTLYPYQWMIKGFYLYDEPFWNVEVNVRKGNSSYVSEQEMYDNLSLVGKLIHKSYSRIPLIYVEAYTMISPRLRIPEVFDWIGMDCYTGFDNCEGQSIPSYYAILKQLQPGKKMVVLPPSMIFKKPQDITNEDRLKVKNIYKQYMSWLQTEKDIILSLSFIYRYDQTTEVFTGAQKICESADIHRLFWRKYYQSQFDKN